MIRKFREEDLQSVMEIWRAANIKAHNFILKSYWNDNYDYVRKNLPKAEIYVYEKNDCILGFVGSNENHIEGIFVINHMQHHGIGTKLLNKIKESRSNLTLNVYKKNVGAVEFYKKNSFNVISENVDEDTCEKDYLMIWER